MKEINDDISLYVMKLIFDHPFFAHLVMKMPREIGNRVPTAAVDGKRLYVNPEFWSSLKSTDKLGLLAHEVMHIGLLHHTRRGSRDHMLWNMACDFAINLILVDAGFTLPEGGLLDKQYEGMSAEEIYSLINDPNNPAYQLAQKMKQQGSGEWKPGDGMPGGMGDVMDLAGEAGGEDGDGNTTPANLSEMDAEEQKVKQDMAAAALSAKMAGKLPGSMERLVGELLNPRADWRELLQQLVSQKANNDYTWKRPNKRYFGVNRRMFFPDIDGETYGNICIVVDTSCSINQHQLDVFASECNSLAEIVSGVNHIMYCDTKVRKVNDAGDRHETFSEGEEIAMVFRGGGGTEFFPPFDYVLKQGLECEMLIYFTDGYCSSFPKYIPDYPVIWAVYDGDKDFSPPFGDVLHIPKDGLND